MKKYKLTYTKKGSNLILSFLIDSYNFSDCEKYFIQYQEESIFVLTLKSIILI